MRSLGELSVLCGERGVLCGELSVLCGKKTLTAKVAKDTAKFAKVFRTDFKELAEVSISSIPNNGLCNVCGRITESTARRTRKSMFKEGTITDVVVYPIRKIYDDRGWLAELFRHDQIAEEFHPQMAYISMSGPEIQRGPHEHSDQADLFCFVGPGNFKLCMWDNRPESPTYKIKMKLIAGDDDPKAVIIPKGVVHAYKNLSAVETGMVINCPNRLYMGTGKENPVDEIRHEDDPDTIYQF